MEEQINNHETVSDEQSASSAEGEGNEEATDEATDSAEDTVDEAVKSSDDAVSLKDMVSEITGRKYPTDEAAEKSLKDTFAHVGKFGKYKDAISGLEDKYGGEQKAIETLKGFLSEESAKPSSGDYVPKDQYDRDMFYREHEEYKDYKGIIEPLQRANPGKSLDDIVKMPEFKSVYDKASAYDKSEKSKSVLHTNPRLAKASDKISEARTTLKEGNYEGASSKAVESVLDAYQD